MLMLFSSSFWTGLVAIFERHTNQILNFGGHSLFIARMVQLWLWYDSPDVQCNLALYDVSVRYGTITQMSILTDCIQLGGEASFRNLEGK